jgi:hypothetical protein
MRKVANNLIVSNLAAAASATAFFVVYASFYDTFLPIFKSCSINITPISLNISQLRRFRPIGIEYFFYSGVKLQDMLCKKKILTF